MHETWWNLSLRQKWTCKLDGFSKPRIHKVIQPRVIHQLWTKELPFCGLCKNLLTAHSPVTAPTRYRRWISNWNKKTKICRSKWLWGRAWSLVLESVMSRGEISWFFVPKNRKIFFLPYTSSVSSVLKASELPTVIHVAKMGELMQKHGQHRTSTNELLTQGWSKISMTIFLIHGSVPQKRYVENRKKTYTLYTFKIREFTIIHMNG